MQIKARTLKILLTLGALIVLLTALMPGALSDESYSGMKSGEMKWSKHHEIKSIDMVKTVTGVTDNSVTFQVPSVAITGKEGKVATMTFPTPLQGAYNLRHGMGFISMQGARSADVAIRPMDNATMNIAGTSMVMSMKGIKVLMDDRDTFMFEYRKLGVLLPDGTAREYYLDKPVKVTYSKDRHMIVIDAYPSLGDILSYAYTNMGKFQTTAPPLSIKDMRTAEMTGRIQTIGTAPILRPAPGGMPTATATPVPTGVPTTTPIATPIVTPTTTPIVSPAPTATAEPTLVPTTTPIIVPEPTLVPTTTPVASPTPVTVPVPAL